MASIKYRQVYSQLGEERVQRGPGGVSRSVDLGSYYASEDEMYWAVRRDYNWSKLPGIFKFVRKTGKREFFETITTSLLHLEPATSFNPVHAWTAELERVREQAERGEKDKPEKNSKKPKKKVDELREKNAMEQYNRRLQDEVVQIRNSKRDPLDIVHQIKIPAARAILLVQILAMAYKQYEKNKEKRLLYEVCWALEALDLPKDKAPKVVDEKLILTKDPSLVYDNVEKVEELIQKARKVMNKDSDLIKVQLVEMSDSLPPLSKFSFGFKLDDWQVRVLTWIDAGKSVVISAPTSSGKTVLSSYVAVIFKAEGGSAAATEGKKDAENDKSAGKDHALSRLEEEEEVDEGDYNDEEEEYLEEGDGGEGEGDVQLLKEAKDFTGDLVQEDLRKRREFILAKRQLLKEDVSVAGVSAGSKVLFVVPTEPLVWQVAAYFTKLLKEQGDRKTPVALVTDQLVFNPNHKFNVMPQIVVGTPFALESALTKPRGLTGRFETKNKVAGDIIPGGFDHFDWVIYDEVHALDGVEGAALQRIIRSMNCKFLALSATVGNAQQLRGWMEQVKGEQLDNGSVECITVASPLKEEGGAKKADPATPPAAAAASEKEVRIVKTNDPLNAWQVILQSSMTLGALKDLVCEHWSELKAEESSAEHLRSPVQVFYQGKDLTDGAKTLDEYGLFAESRDEVILYVPARVYCLAHSTRFINLQRYVWDTSNKTSGGTITTVSPLSAISSVQELQQGILHNSSLSFTSSDSFRVYEEAKKVFPPEAVALISPYNFFGERERITLMRVKAYEDLLKTGLQQLAMQYPAQTQSLLNVFAVQDGAKEVDLCELVLQLKANDMLPCLPFHLNTFEAIRLFQQVLAGLEYRQKRDHPIYYMDLESKANAQRSAREKAIKATGGDSKKEEELARMGEIESAEGLSVDSLAPHPDYVVCKGSPLSDRELDDIVHEMEMNDGFDKRDVTGGSQRGKNIEILTHALVRGLRRGIGLFIEEVSFPSYRRAVQKLASQGKLGVVISDSSLAFGVNMPFRTTVFCGEMRGALDELMAQQMSGRAGRRGLDTQGNIVYAGVRAKVMRRLMIGTVSDIQGVDSRQVKYETLFLQAVLSPRHTGYSRVKTLGKITLRDYIEKKSVNNHVVSEGEDNFAMQVSRKCLLDLGFVAATNKRDYRPNSANGVTYGLLCIMWEMRQNVHESITIGMLYNQLLDHFNPIIRDLSLSDKKHTTDFMDPHVFSFFSLFTQLIARTPYDPNDKGGVKILDLPYFSLPAHQELFKKWEAIFAAQQEKIPEEYKHLRDPVPPHTQLDGSFFQCILDRQYIHSLSDNKKQQLKQSIWHVGNVLKVFTNCGHIEDGYMRIARFIFRNAFLKLRYLNSELIRSIAQLECVCDADKEKRVEKDNGALIKKPKEAEMWSDLDETPWAIAVARTLQQASACSDPAAASSLAQQRTDSLAAILPPDLQLILTLLSFSSPADKQKAKEERRKVIKALQACSFTADRASVKPALAAHLPSLRLVGLLVWFCTALNAQQMKWFAVYLSEAYDDELVSEEAAKLFVASLSLQDLSAFLPHAGEGQSAGGCTEDRLGALKKNCEPFMKWLEEQDEEDEEDEEEDEDEEI